MAGLSAHRNKGPAGWFKLEDGQTKEIFIPVELRDMTREVVHASPTNYIKNAICTYDSEGMCYACEQGTFQWLGRVKIYIPVVHNGKMYIMVQGTGTNSPLWPLAEHFQEHGTSIGWFNISRNGNGKRTKYTIEAVDKPHPMVYNKKVDLSNHLHKVAYSEQEIYYS